MKQVTEASAAVVGYERREGYILDRAGHRKKITIFKSKRDIVKLMK